MVTRLTGIDELLLDGSLLPFRMRAVSFRPASEPRRPAHAPRPIRGLLLDACNILYDDTDWRRWLLRLLLRLGLRTEYGPFFRIFDRDYLDAVYRGERPFNEALDAFLISAGLSAGQAEEVHRALDSHRRQSDASHRPLIGVRETVAQLHCFRHETRRALQQRAFRRGDPATAGGTLGRIALGSGDFLPRPGMHDARCGLLPRGPAGPAIAGCGSGLCRA